MFLFLVNIFFNRFVSKFFLAKIDDITFFRLFCAKLSLRFFPSFQATYLYALSN